MGTTWPRPRYTMPEDTTTQKPVGPFEDFEACVAHFEGDPEVDDPQALCGWMEENQEAEAVQQYAPSEDDVQALVEAMKAPEAESVLTDLQVTYVSGVENPAQDSAWVMAKDADAHGADWGVSAPLLLQKGTTLQLDEDGEGGEEQQKAWAAVLIPDEVDKQGDVIPADAIEQAAHKFLATYRKIDTDHDLFEGKGTPIESWTLKEASTFTLPDGSESREYPKGTWMMGVRFVDDAWERIKSGELTGFSIYGEATQHDIQEILGGEGDLDVDLEADAGADVARALSAKSAGDTQAEADPGGNTRMDENTDDDGDSAEKQLPADVLQVMADSVDAFLAADDTEPDEAALGEFIQWGLDSGEFEATEVTVGGVTYTAENAEEDETDEQPEDEPEETEMDDSPDEGEEQAEEAEASSVKEMLEDVRDTVHATKSSVESHGERLEALEAEVFEKDTEGEDAETAPDAAENQPDVDEAAEKAVKSVLGLDELPEDPEERREVMRKHLHEQTEETGLSSPDEWTDEDTATVVK